MKRIIVVAAAALLSGAVAAQSYPSKPIRFIVPYPAGGGSDIMARNVAEKLGSRLGRQVIVDNRGGASTVIGTEIAAKAPADGYTLLQATVTTLAVVPSIKSRLPYEFARDFVPITLLATQPYVLVSHPTLPVTTMRELIAYAKTNPGRLNFGSPGVGAGGHIAGEMLKSMAGLDMTHIAYKGTGPAVADVLGGHISLVFATIPAVQSFVKDGRLRAYAVTTAKRSAAMPNTPTIAESGVRGYETNSWTSLLAPRGVPADIVQRLNREVTVVLKSPDVVERLVQQGFEPEPTTPQELADYVRSEAAKYAKLLKSMGISDL